MDEMYDKKDNDYTREFIELGCVLVMVWLLLGTVCMIYTALSLFGLL